MSLALGAQQGARIAFLDCWSSPCLLPCQLQVRGGGVLRCATQRSKPGAMHFPPTVNPRSHSRSAPSCRNIPPPLAELQISTHHLMNLEVFYLNDNCTLTFCFFVPPR